MKMRKGLIPFLALLVALTIYGGGKQRKGRVIYPWNVETQAYLIDEGSSVGTNDVYFAFWKSPLVPDTAEMQIWTRSIDSTNDTDWVMYTNTTFEAFNQPRLIEYPGAISNDFEVFTTWSPGPVVHTNGIAVIEWKYEWRWQEAGYYVDENGETNAVYIDVMEPLPVYHFRPDRTYFYLDDEKVAPNIKE